MTAKVFAAALVVLVAFGCTDPPTTSTALNDEAVAPAFTVDRQEYTYIVDLGGGIYEDCAGEDMQLHGKILVYIREKTTPSGSLIVHGWVDYHFEQITAEGLTSGDIWTLTNGLNPFGEVTKENGSYRLHYQWKEFYSNPDGQKLQVHVNGVYQTYPDGSVKIERERVRCF